MGKLADSLNKKVDEYISFKDLLSKISEDNNEPLYDVVTYLLHHSLDENVGFYFIDLNFKVFESEYIDINQIHNALSSIKTLLTFDYENWIFTTDNLKELNEHTERELGRILFDNIYIHYKKSEIASFKPLEGLLGFLDIDSKPQVGKEDPQINLLQRDPFLTNLDIFTVIEASCLISGDDPIQIEICLGDTYFKQNNIDYLKAESFISAGIKSGKLDSDITRQSLQKFLLEKGYVIEGFNDNLPPATADKIGHATITQTMPTDSQLSQQVADLNAQLASATDTIASLQDKLQQSNFDRLESYNFHIAELHRVKTESNQYQKENESLKAKIAKLEANQPSQNDTPADGEPLFDELDPRTQNNFIRLLLAVNEMAKDKQGQSLDYGRDYNKENLQAVNAKLDLLSYDNIGETAFKTLATLIRDKQAKGL